MVIRTATDLESSAVGLALVPEPIENRENGKIETKTISLPVVIQ